jgi:hypothetical protein
MTSYNNVFGTGTLSYPRCIPTTAFASIKQANSEENIIIVEMPTNAKYKAMQIKTQ